MLLQTAQAAGLEAAGAPQQTRVLLLAQRACPPVLPAIASHPAYHSCVLQIEYDLVQPARDLACICSLTNLQEANLDIHFADAEGDEPLQDWAPPQPGLISLKRLTLKAWVYSVALNEPCRGFDLSCNSRSTASTQSETVRHRGLHSYK